MQSTTRSVHVFKYSCLKKFNIQLILAECYSQRILQAGEDSIQATGSKIRKLTYTKDGSSSGQTKLKFI